MEKKTQIKCKTLANHRARTQGYRKHPYTRNYMDKRIIRYRKNLELWIPVAGFYAGNNTGTGNASQIRFGVSNSTGNSAEWRFVYQGDNDSLNRIDFGWNGYVTPAISYLVSGNVGIGTTNPTATLDVNGIGKFKDDILIPFYTWSNTTDRNSLKKFLELFDLDTAGNLVVNTNLYSTGEVTGYSSGAGVSGLKLMGDMNAIS